MDSTVQFSSATASVYEWFLNQQYLTWKDICETKISNVNKPNLENPGQKVKKAYFYIPQNMKRQITK